MFDKSRTFSLVTLNSFLAFSIACFTSLAKVELYTLIFICLEILGLAIEVIVSVVSPLFLPVTFNPSIVTILSLLEVTETFLFNALAGVNVTFKEVDSLISKVVYLHLLTYR